MRAAEVTWGERLEPFPAEVTLNSVEQDVVRKFAERGKVQGSVI
jgi:hypothetical protein